MIENIIMQGTNRPDFPEGRQISYLALQAMGMTSGDIADVMNEYRYDSGLRAGGFEKMTRTMEEQGETAQDELFQQQRADELRREQEEQRQQQQRQQQQFQDQARQQQMGWEEKQRFDQQMIEKHAADEKANRNILGAASAFVLFPLGLGLSESAIGTTGRIMSGATAGLGDTAMVASNNGGGLFGELRGALGIGAPGEKDMLLTGPNELTPFTPGKMPELAQQAPAANIGQDMNQNPFMMGMNQMPGMAPKV